MKFMKAEKGKRPAKGKRMVVKSPETLAEQRMAQAMPKRTAKGGRY
jgi:hypothetical protein